MGTKRIIHVVGTGTIGEPLIGLLLHARQALAVDEVTFYKHSPRLTDRAKIVALIRRGAKLTVEAGKMPKRVRLSSACNQLTVKIPCRPSNKPLW